MRTVLAGDFDIVGSVNNGRDVVAEVHRLDPDVLVIDISIPIVDGLQAASQPHSGDCRTKIVFLTVHEDQDFVAPRCPRGRIFCLLSVVTVPTDPLR